MKKNLLSQTPEKHETIKYLLSLLKVFVLFSIFNLSIVVNMFAQTTAQRAQIISRTNVAALQQLSIDLGAMATQKRVIAEQWAVAHGYPISGINPNGQSFFIYDYDSIFGPKYAGTNNLIAAKTISTNKLWNGGSSGLNLSGSQIEILMWDEGKICDQHPEILNRTIIGDSPPNFSNHATHIAGTLIASGVDNNAKGMAPNSTLKYFSFPDYEAELPIEAATGTIISNHSWNNHYQTWLEYVPGSFGWNIWENYTENPHYGLYTGYARDEDLISNNAPYHLIVRCAGNDRGKGPPDGATHAHNQGIWVGGFSDSHEKIGGQAGFDCIAEHACAKNTLTVGAVADISNGYSLPTDVILASFSGTGPTDDGRIKPDIVANGVGVYSSYGPPSQNCSSLGYSSENGTSMAAASVSGSCVLLQEHYSNTHSGDFMLSSTLKALLIESADEAGASNGPDYQFGWGLLNAKKAAEIISMDQIDQDKIQELTLSQFQTIDIPITVTNGNNCYLSATIAWNDPAGIAATSPYVVDPTDIRLVNDLDLVIIDPNNTTRFPWRLTPFVPALPAIQTTDNFRDNVEQVRIYDAIPGTYIARINHKGLLSNSQDFSIIINLDPVISISANDPLSFCQGGNAILTATGGLNNYQWYNSLGAINGANSSTLLATTSETYYCVTTNSNGCEGISNSIVVTVWPKPVINAIPTNSTCIPGDDGSIFISTASGTAPFTYYANGGTTGPHSFTTSSTSHTFSTLQNDNYDVYVIDVNGCTSVHNYVDIISTTSDCCIFNQNFPASGTFTNQSFDLNQSITLSGNLILDNCEIACAAGMNITVPAGLTLTISQTYFYSCGDMWEGIVVQEEGILNIQKQSVIEDAEHGVYAIKASTNTSKITISNSEFRNNYIGIFVQPNTVFNKITLKVTGTSFNSYSPLKNSLNISPIGETGFAGIVLNDINCTIGKFPGALNIFDNLHSGILSHRSITTLYSCDFKDIVFDPEYMPSVFGGHAVHADGNSPAYSLYVFGNTNSFFRRCGKGIFSEGTRVNIVHTNMRDVSVGIQVRALPVGSTSLIQFNEIECFDAGIISSFNNAIGILEMFQNTIVVDDDLARGIGIGSYEGGVSREVNIFENNITILRGYKAIELIGANKQKVVENTIDLTQSTPIPGELFAGISLEASNQNNVACNTVTGNADFSNDANQHYGFFTSLSTDNDIQCNSSTSIYKGFQFDGNCSMLEQFKGNYMSNNWTGLNLEMSGEVNTQTHKGNMWYPPFNNSDDAINNGNSNASKFYINSIDPIEYRPSSPNPSFGWFIPDNNGNYFDCISNNVCPENGSGGGESKGMFDYLIANENYNPLDFPDESKDLANRYLYEKINSDGSLMNELVFMNFYSEYQLTSIADYAEVKENKELIFQQTNPNSIVIENNMNLIENYHLQLRENDSLYAGGVIDSLTYETFSDSVSLLMTPLAEYIKPLAENYRVLQNVKNDDVKNMNDGLGFSNKEYEMNEKKVNEIYLSTVSRGNYSFTVDQKNILLSIIHQCPFTGGPAVYLARALYRIIDPNEVYEDFQICTQLGLFRKARPEIKSGSYSFTYPNPTSKAITLVYNLLNDKNAELVIYNSALSLVHSELINSTNNQKVINVESLNPDLYFYNIIQDNHVVSFGKFCIVR